MDDFGLGKCECGSFLQCAANVHDSMCTNCYLIKLDKLYWAEISEGKTELGAAICAIESASRSRESTNGN